MPKNIKRICLSEPAPENMIRLVRVEFEFPCTYTYFNIDDLLEIIRLWIVSEEEKYPQAEGNKGRWLLFDKIVEVFGQA